MQNAAMVPFKIMKTAFSAFEVIREMVEKGNPNSVTDAAVGAIALRGCIRGAYLNVRINSESIKDKKFTDELIRDGAVMEKMAEKEEKEILSMTDLVIRKPSR